MPFPLRLQRRDVDDDAATRVGALAQANGQYIARNAEVLDGAGKREGVRRDDANITLNVDKALVVKVFRVNDRRVDIGEYLELVGAAHIVAIARHPVGNDTLALGTANLALDKGFDHPLFLGHGADPAVGFDAHGGS